MKISNDPTRMFSLRVKLFINEPAIAIHAFAAGFSPPNHNRIDVEVRQGGKVIFPRGALYCAFPGGFSDNARKELVMALVAMCPGDTDPDYFADYTPEQLAWAKHNGESLSVERQARYCDKNGNVR